MSVKSYIPQLWAARLLANLKNQMVYANLVNRDYEGEIKEKGDTVHINSIGKVTAKKYTKSSDIDAPEELTTTDQKLVIDQADYFNFSIDDVDKAQVAGDVMDAAMSEAANSLTETAEKFIADQMKVGTAAKKYEAEVGNDEKPVVVTADNAYTILVRLKVALDKANVPKEGRWVVVPSDYEGFILTDPRFAYNTDKSNERLESGIVARAAGFKIYTSNNVPNTGEEKFKIIASYNATTTYAEQITEMEAFRPEKRFADAMKGLHVYGAKVTRPECIAVATVNFSAPVV